MDAEVRNSTLSGYFNADKSPGLIEILTGDSTLKEAEIQNVAANLNFLPTGKYVDNTTELLTGQRLATLLEELKGLDYDFLILDTPPVILVADPIAISDYSDQLLFVVSCRQTKRDLLIESLEKLSPFSDRKQLDFILNRAERRSGSYGYYLRVSPSNQSKKADYYGSQRAQKKKVS